jgi:hypothetical protein
MNKEGKIALFLGVCIFWPLPAEKSARLFFKTQKSSIMQKNYFYLAGGAAVLGVAFAVYWVQTKARRAVETAVGRDLDKEQKKSVSEIVRSFTLYGDGDKKKLAYLLATAWKESRLKPIAEIRAAPGTAVYDLQNNYWGTGYYGRGLSQLTWRGNYEKFSELLGLPLVENPDLVLRPEVAADVLVLGGLRGLFRRDGSGAPYSLGRFLGPSLDDYYGARAVYNGMSSYPAEYAALAREIYAGL